MSVFKRVVLQAETTHIVGTINLPFLQGSPESNPARFTSAAILYVTTTNVVTTPSLVVTLENVVMGTVLTCQLSSAITTARLSVMPVGIKTVSGGYGTHATYAPLSPDFNVKLVVGGTGTIDVALEMHYFPTSMSV